MSELKSRFLKFGWSSWRSKIDPKRPQEMKNNDEEDRTRRGEKKDNKDDKKREYELSKCFDRVWPANDGSATQRKPDQFGRPRPPGSHHIRAVKD